MIAYQCTECGEPLERGRCPDRECREPREVTHWCPFGDAATTPCCGRSPFELPRTDRMTVEPHLVTCGQPDVLELRDPPADPRSVLP